MWQPISTAPQDQSLELAVIDSSGTHALIFPCCRTAVGWAHAITGKIVVINPTHWQLWRDDENTDLITAANELRSSST
jgi:hypothetical protein